jgi:hypothetical protein
MKPFFQRIAGSRPALNFTLRPHWVKVKKKYKMLWHAGKTPHGIVAYGLLFEVA